MAELLAPTPLVGVFLAVMASFMALLPGRGSNATAEAHRLTRAAVRACRRLIVRFGRTRIVELVLATRSGRILVEELISATAVSEGLKNLITSESEAAGALVAALAFAGVSAGVLFASAVAGLVAMAALALGGAAHAAAASRRRAREVAASMPGIYRTLSVVMGSGQTLAQAVEYVGSHERGPAATVFARMSMRLRCGMGTEEAVGLLAKELDCVGSELLATALVISHRTGSPLKDLLMRSARLVERAEEFERLLQVKTAQVRLSVRIVCFMPAILIGVLALISPDFQQGLLTPAGAGCVLVAAALDGVALLVIRRLIKGVL